MLVSYYVCSRNGLNGLYNFIGGGRGKDISHVITSTSKDNSFLLMLSKLNTCRIYVLMLLITFLPLKILYKWQYHFSCHCLFILFSRLFSFITSVTTGLNFDSRQLLWSLWSIQTFLAMCRNRYANNYDYSTVRKYSW